MAAWRVDCSWAGGLAGRGWLLGHAGTSPDDLYRRASAAYFAGRYDEAAADVDRLERIRPPNRFDRLLRGMIASSSNEPEKAIAELSLIGDEDPLAPLARTIAGQTEIRQGRTRPAEASFRAAIKLLPSAVQARRELIYIYNIQHRQLEMDAQVTALSQVEVLDFQYLLRWSKTRNVPWSPKAGLPILEKYVKADPDDRWSRLALAEGLRRLARREEAEEVLVCPARFRSRGPRGPGDAGPGPGRYRAGRVACHARAGRLPCHWPAFEVNWRCSAMTGPRPCGRTRTALAADPLDRSTLSGLGTALKMAGDDRPASYSSRPPIATMPSGN